MKNSGLRSMTGFASAEGDLVGTRTRVELRSLNHRFLDIKTRLPRAYSEIDIRVRNFLQSEVVRGALELKMEGASGGKDATPQYQPNVSLAAHYYESVINMQRTLGLTDPIKTSDILAFPDVMTRVQMDEQAVAGDQVWSDLEPLLRKVVEKLEESRLREGARLKEMLSKTAKEMADKVEFIRKRRKECQKEFTQAAQERVKKAFEAHPIEDKSVQSLLESRVAQEVALALDKSDIEEELVRLGSHLDLFQTNLKQGSPIGRKLEFVLQEVNREVNTIGNKAQDFAIGEEVVQIKVRLEQLREQALNVE